VIKMTFDGIEVSLYFAVTNETMLNLGTMCVWLELFSNTSLRI